MQASGAEGARRTRIGLMYNTRTAPVAQWIEQPPPKG